MKLLIILVLSLALCSCGKKKENGYGCISKYNAILQCKAFAALKYQNPTLYDYQERQCTALYPADVCYQSLYHEDRI